MQEKMAESMRQAVASLRMEGMKLTPAETADLERIVRGELTIEQSLAELNGRVKKLKEKHPELFAGSPEK